MIPLFRRGRPTPTFLQMETAECGAACLAMVLAAFGRWESLDAVRDSCGASRDGTSAADLVIAAQARGLEAQAYSRDLDGLAKLPLPQILFWNFDHFVVLERIGRREIQINDPAFGRRIVSRAEFGASFTGVTLTFRRGPDFRVTARPRSTLLRLFDQLHGSWTAFFAIVFTSAVMVVVGALVPGLTQIFVDDYLTEGRSNLLLPLFAAIIAVGLFNAGFGYLYLHGLLLLRTKINAVVSARYIWSMFHLPYEFFGRRSAVEISSRPQLAMQVANTVSGPAAQIVVNATAMVGYAAVMLLYSPLLTAVTVGLGAVELLILRQVSRRVQDHAVRLQMAAGQAHAASVQGVALLEQARATGSDGILFNRMIQAEAELVNAEQSSGRVLHLMAALPYAMSRITTLVILGAGTLLIIHTGMSIGELVGFLALSGLFSAALNAFTGIGTAVGQATAALGRLGDALDHSTTPADAPPIRAVETGSAPTATGGVRFRGIAFAYPGSPAILSETDLTIAPGEAIGLLGGSGSGKSTLARLIVGLVPPDKGDVLYEAEDAGQTARATAWIRDCRGIAFVDQQPFFPRGSLLSAVTFWNDGVPPAVLSRALADAEIRDVILGRPGGLDGPIGENGTGFSVGEQQRLAIARALVDQPRLLVLDDATSNLDEETEARVIENLRRRGITFILLTSRLGATAHLDRVFRLAGGHLHPLEEQTSRAPARRSAPAQRLAAVGSMTS